MVFSDILQIKFKKTWWVDAIFYFAISALIATLFCYGIFLAKNALIKNEITKVQTELLQFGSNQQKDHEKKVLEYQAKIKDFSDLLKNHKFASNAFAFMREQTRPNVWFKQFGFSRNSGQIQLTGEAEDMNALARQVSAFETNEYVKSISSVSSAVGMQAKVDFNFSITLNDNVFSYEYFSQENQPKPEEKKPVDQTAQQEQKSGEKAIVTFGLTNPAVSGAIDQDRNIMLNVPIGTDITKLAPLITLSPNATVLPASDVPQNFTNDVVYTVTAQDGSAQSYIVKVKFLQTTLPESSSAENMLPTSGSKKSSMSSWFNAVAIEIVIGVVIILTIIIFKKIKKKNAS